MLKVLFLAAACVLSSSIALGQVHGVDVQVNEGKAIPSLTELDAVLRPRDFVRDVMGWQKVDLHCALAAHPTQPIKIPAALSTLYANVQAAGGQNFVTLAFNNTHCGQSSISGAVTFPNTDRLRAEFAAYAVRVVKQVPALGGISIWNEMNGTWNGGYRTQDDALTAYCALSNAVIAAVRQVDPAMPIAIGATVGWNVDGWFISMFDTYGCVGKGDPTIWLDVHPYLTGKKEGHDTDWDFWSNAIGNVRADGITNPLVATEWGGAAAVQWSARRPSGDYIAMFNAKVLSQDSPWAGSMWYDLLSSGNSQSYSLFGRAGTVLTQFGTQYSQTFGP